MELIIVTGISGAGKSKAVMALEDMSFYCVDNIPPELIHPFVDICRRTKIERIALVVDIRGGVLFDSMIQQLKKINELEIKYKILFLDAEDDVIITRYKQTRRKHPLVGEQYKTMSEAITAEREKLEYLKIMASYVLNTSKLTNLQLKSKIKDLFLIESDDGMIINLISFGFKNGLPHDTDLVFDVRCLPNPFYEQALKYRTGKEKCVQDYIMKSSESQTFKDKMIDMLDFLIPLYIKEGKSQLVISVGCTGGRHRSVTFVEFLAKHFSDNGHKVFVSHRDIDQQ